MKTIDVSVIGDILYEQNEEIRVRLSNASNARLSGLEDAFGGWIRDDDPRPRVWIVDGYANEGDRGRTDMAFTVVLSDPSGAEVSWATEDLNADGAATAGDDYLAASGTLTFAAGERMKTIGVSVTGDTLDEDDEAFRVRITDFGRGVSFRPGWATATIWDDDP